MTSSAAQTPRATRAGHRADRLRRTAAAHHLGAGRAGAAVQPAASRCRRHGVLPRSRARGGGRGGAGGGSDAAALSAQRSTAATFVTGVAEYDVSADGRKLLYRTRRRRRRPWPWRPRPPARRRQSVSRRRRSQRRRRQAQGRLNVSLRMYLDPKRGVQADLQRRLAQPARLSLRAEHARRRLAEDEGDVRRSCCRTSMHRADLNYLLDNMGAEIADRPLVRARRRHAGRAAVAGRPARRRLRDRERALQDHAHLRQRELESGSARAARRARRRTSTSATTSSPSTASS